MPRKGQSRRSVPLCVDTSNYDINLKRLRNNQKVQKQLQILLEKIKDNINCTEMEWLQLCSKVPLPQQVKSELAELHFKDVDAINATPLDLDVPSSSIKKEFSNW